MKWILALLALGLAAAAAERPWDWGDADDDWTKSGGFEISKALCRKLRDREPPASDGHLTRAEGLGLLVLVADCLPVALAAPGQVAMLHCGWRGLAGGIVERALAAFDTPPAAAIGPGIGRCCYEVGEEVLAAFADLDGVADGRMLDLRAVAERRLRAAGVEHVEHVDECTSCRPDLFFSHRRDHGVTGRQCGIAVRA